MVNKKFCCGRKRYLYWWIWKFDEVFLTNSLLGIMSVKNIEKFEFSSKSWAKNYWNL